MFINRIGGAGVNLAIMKAAIIALGPTLFLDADSISGSDGDSIATWADESGNSRNFTQSTAGYKPLLKKTTNGINGHNVLRFDGSDDFLQPAANRNTFIAVGAHTIWLVYKIFAITTDGTNAWSNEAAIADESEYFGYYFRSSVGAIAYIDDGSVRSASKAISTSVAIITKWRHTGGNQYMSINGGSEATSAAGNVGGTDSQLILGSGNEDGEEAQIDIAELIIFNSALSAANQSVVDRYLRLKYKTY